jgi:hypothetical protein
MTTHPPTHHSLFDNSWFPKTRQSLNHPTPYLPDLASCDFFLFTKMKLRLKGRRFDTIGEIQAESQEVLNTLTLENFQGCMESLKDAGIAVYMPKGTASKETVETKS